MGSEGGRLGARRWGAMGGDGEREGERAFPPAGATKVRPRRHRGGRNRALPPAGATKSMRVNVSVSVALNRVIIALWSPTESHGAPRSPTEHC